MIHGIKIEKCKGEGHGTCKRCTDLGRWNVTWMCFLYKIEGIDGIYCRNCANEIIKQIEGDKHE